MKTYLVVVHRFNNLGYDIFEINHRMKGLVARCDGQSTLRELADTKKLKSYLVPRDAEGSNILLYPENIQKERQIYSMDCDEKLGVLVKNINAQGEIKIAVLYYDVEE